MTKNLASVLLLDSKLSARLCAIVDMQNLAHDRFAALYPDDSKVANSAFLSFAGMLGQVWHQSVFLKACCVDCNTK